MTFVDVLWSLFHLLKGMSVRMEHATASSASSDAVEIRLQELRSSAATRGRNSHTRAMRVGITIIT